MKTGKSIYSYKDLKDVTLDKIYEKYAHKDLTIYSFRNRIYQRKLTMEEAVNNPPKGRFLHNSAPNIYINKLYKKLCAENPIHVTSSHFRIKLAKGYAPEVAILKSIGKNLAKSLNPDGGLIIKVTKPPKNKKRLNKNNEAEIIHNLKAREKREKDLYIKSIARPFTVKEKEYLKNIKILNKAFNCVKSTTYTT